MVIIDVVCVCEGGGNGLGFFYEWLYMLLIHVVG